MEIRCYFPRRAFLSRFCFPALSALALAAGWTPGLRADDAAGAKPGKSTVVWISMDGMRGDYLDRPPLPFFARLMKEGAYSRKFHPVFPPITFPSHCAEATGVAVDRHGITGNSFYDTGTRMTYRYPGDAALLQAEPIWLTAERQGVRTLVYDWPLSQAEDGPVRADFFNEKFENGPTDAQRMDHLLDTWRADKAGPPRLLMGYVEDADVAGHKYGPDAPELTAAVQGVDRTLGVFFERALAQWKETAGPSDRFYLLLSTDHGMSPVTKAVNLEKLLGLPRGQKEIMVSTVGNMGNVFLDQIAEGPAREERLAGFLEKLKAYPFIRAYRKAELPAAWAYAHPTRTGDLVVVLPRGYTMSSQATQPVMDIAQAGGGPLGMHGYPVEDDPEMYGALLVWRYPQPFGGKDLGEVNWNQYHPTVAKWLGIQPADGAKGAPLALPGE